jgi:hypothetical protein
LESTRDFTDRTSVLNTALATAGDTIQLKGGDFWCGTVDVDGVVKVPTGGAARLTSEDGSRVVCTPLAGDVRYFLEVENASFTLDGDVIIDSNGENLDNTGNLPRNTVWWKADDGVIDGSVTLQNAGSSSNTSTGQANLLCGSGSVDCRRFSATGLKCKNAGYSNTQVNSHESTWTNCTLRDGTKKGFNVGNPGEDVLSLIVNNMTISTDSTSDCILFQCDPSATPGVGIHFLYVNGLHLKNSPSLSGCIKYAKAHYAIFLDVDYVGTHTSDQDYGVIGAEENEITYFKDLTDICGVTCYSCFPSPSEDRQENLCFEDSTFGHADVSHNRAMDHIQAKILTLKGVTFNGIRYIDSTIVNHIETDAASFKHWNYKNATWNMSGVPADTDLTNFWYNHSSLGLTFPGEYEIRFDGRGNVINDPNGAGWGDPNFSTQSAVDDELKEAV